MCQLKCPLCDAPKRKNNPSLIGWGYLKFKNFKKIVDENPEIRIIELSNNGEIFLNPELEKIIKYAYEKKINLLAATGVNLNNISKEMIRCLVKYKFACLTVSLDGASQEIYSIYRKGGDFNNVIKNIRLINYYKKIYNSRFPALIWQFVIFGHNEHEIPIARKFAKSLNMNFKPKLSWDKDYSKIKNKDFVRKESGLGVASRKEFQGKYNKYYLDVCNQLWKSPVINWDGKLLGCCKNIYSDFGNVFKSGLKNCLENEKYSYTKEMLLNDKKPRKDIPCSKCYIYKNKLYNIKV